MLVGPSVGVASTGLSGRDIRDCCLLSMELAAPAAHLGFRLAKSYVRSMLTILLN
jgi:hypothetical protein